MIKNIENEISFDEFKTEVLKRAKKVHACVGEYKKVFESKTIEELIIVLKNNICFVRQHKIIDKDLITRFETPSLFDAGKDNVGFFNSGNRNLGDLNSGDLNSGFRNSGVFCNKKRGAKIIIFNKESDMSWDDWYNHRVYHICLDLSMTEWVSWSKMTDQEKLERPKTLVCNGYLKTYEYKEAWSNLWKSLDDEQKEAFKTLPNFDAEVFEDITGIKIK